MSMNNDAITARQLFDANRKKLADEHAGRLALFDSSGLIGTYGEFRDALAAAQERCVLGRCHIGYLSAEGAWCPQLADLRYDAREDCGLVVPLSVAAPSWVNGGTKSEPQSCRFKLDSGADLTKVRGAILDAVGAPTVAVAAEWTTQEEPKYMPLYVVSIFDGPSGVHVDNWIVVRWNVSEDFARLTGADALLGRDVLHRCEIRYRPPGRVALRWLA